MKRSIRRTLLPAVLLALLLQCVGARALELGDRIEDFSVSCIDGERFTLSEALADKDVVLISLWATWSPACEDELAALQRCCETHREDVAAIALSIEPADSAAVLQSFADSRGLSLPIASDSEAGLSRSFYVSALPTTIVVDRFSRVVMIHNGPQCSDDAFELLVSAYVGDSYTETRVLHGVPSAASRPQAADAAALDRALNPDGGALHFRNSQDALNWPMQPYSAPDRQALVSGNAGQDETVSAVLMELVSDGAQQLAFDFRTSTERAMDLLSVRVDGEVRKAFSGEHPWTTWVLPLSEGAHTVEFRYSKDVDLAEGEDRVWLSNVRLVSAEEAEEIRAAMPVHPAAAENAILPEGAREIVFDGPASSLESLLQCQHYWILNGQELSASVTLTADVDEDAAYVLSNYDNKPVAVTALSQQNRYTYRAGIDTQESSGYSFTAVYLYGAADLKLCGICCFADEENADSFLNLLQQYGYSVTAWHYLE